MFGFGNTDKVTHQIGEILHLQLSDALIEDEASVNERLMSLFTNGYVGMFTVLAYQYSGLDGKRLAEKNLIKILDGVFPDRLPDIFRRQMERRNLQMSISDEGRLKQPEMYSGVNDLKYHDISQECAEGDAKKLVDGVPSKDIRGWFNYLAGKGAYKKL